MRSGTSWTAIRLPCSHIFCEACILKWLARCGSCPTCRAEVSAPSISKKALIETPQVAVPQPLESVVFAGSQIDTRPLAGTIPPRPMSALSTFARRDGPPRPSSAALRPAVSRSQQGPVYYHQHHNQQHQQRPLQMSVTSLEFSGIGIKRAPSTSTLQSPPRAPLSSHSRPTTATSRLVVASLQRPATAAASTSTTTQRPLSQSHQQLRPTSAAFQRHISLSTRPASASSSRHPNTTMRPLAVVGLHMSKSK